MASRFDQTMPLDDPDLTEVWLRSLAAKARHKKLKDMNTCNEVTDLFLSQAGIEAIRKVSLMVYPNILEAMTFEEIRKEIMEKLRPKKRLLLAERSNFMTTVQETSETIQCYLQRLRHASRFCEFENLGRNQSIEDDLIQLRLITGLASSEQRSKIMEYVQTASSEMTLEQIVQLVQQLEMISSFGKNETSDTAAVARITSSVIKDCKFCGGEHLRQKCPAYGKLCNNCKKKNHFSKVCRLRGVKNVQINDDSKVTQMT